ncbi:hypothetical protein ACB092_11G048900 [Castanea dentata]
MLFYYFLRLLLPPKRRPRFAIPPHANRNSTAPPSVQNVGHHQSFSPTTQRFHLLRHHPSPALYLSALPISHSQQFLPLSNPQFFSPTTLLTPGFLPPGLYVKTIPLAAQMLDVRRNQKLEMIRVER